MTLPTPRSAAKAKLKTQIASRTRSRKATKSRKIAPKLPLVASLTVDALPSPDGPIGKDQMSLDILSRTRRKRRAPKIDVSDSSAATRTTPGGLKILEGDVIGEKPLSGAGAATLKKTGLLRARGLTWGECGKQLGVAESSLKGLSTAHRDEYIRWLAFYEDQVIMEQAAEAGSFQMLLLRDGSKPDADVPTRKLAESAAHSIKAHRAKLFPLRQIHEAGESIQSVVERLAKLAEGGASEWDRALDADILDAEAGS